MSSEEQANAAPVVAPAPVPPPAPAAPWMRAEVWMLGAFSVIGLVGFVATFVLLFMRSPNTPVARTLSAAEIRQLIGPKGETGPAGARGPAGEVGVRVLRSDCSAGACTAECADDEILLTAYCSPNRTPAVYPTERSAQCRAQPGRGKVDVVAACAKSARR